ncbi:carbonic anhydrase [Glonium stellatum]|uniref:Carbonic anhydrase n=1 Tax=Glonium stellatum TaxID=574774 RepID=A0A8E2F8Q3_9PEZI|nr:carbonic anhydrase [Glonium stellatum]
MSPTVAELLERNRQLAATHEPSPTLSEMGKEGKSPPKILIVTCVDPRCNPAEFLGLNTGDALVFRNICGHITPVLKDIAAFDVFLGLSDIMVIHHTDCGATHFTDDFIRDGLKKRFPTNGDIDSMSFGAITDLEQSVKDDLEILRKSPLITKELAERSVGFVYDIKSGLLTAVEE